MKGFFKDFAKFIKRGNVLDMAVGVIIGSAFTKIVTSLTNDLIMPIITFFMGENSLNNLSIVLRPGSEAVVDETGAILQAATDPLLFKYGVFLQTIIDFLLIAVIVFIIVRLVGKVSKELDFNAKMKEQIQVKLDNDDVLEKYEERWMKRMAKKNPEMVPKKAEVVVAAPPAPPAPTEAELLASILEELKKNNANNQTDGANN